MKLYTERHGTDYERIVDICVLKVVNELPYITNTDVCKLVLLKKGSLTLRLSADSVEQKEIKAPAAIFFSSREEIVICDDTKFEATIVYFKPSVINDVFQYERLYAGEFEDLQGTTIYQDYLIIRNFVQKEAGTIHYSRLTDVSLAKLLDLIEKMKRDLDEQYDGYWPCRSRTFFIEILFFLNFCYSNDPCNIENKSSFTTQVIEYLNRHIDEKLDLERITKKFHVNRNYLNQEFTRDTGMTCLAYVVKLRIDLAKLWLAETEIPIHEIGRRLGYLDHNYFTKVFHKECGVSPSQYRNDYSQNE